MYACGVLVKNLARENTSSRLDAFTKGYTSVKECFQGHCGNNYFSVESMSWKYCNVCMLSLSFTKSDYITFCCRCLLSYSIHICALAVVHFFTALRPVDSDLCLNAPPHTTQLCHINCPVECEVSSWSAWGPCTYENCQDQTAKKGKTFLHHSNWKSRLFIFIFSK